MAQHRPQFGQLQPFGEAALRVVWPAVIADDTRTQVHALVARLRQAPLPGVTDIVPTYAAVTVHFDPFVLQRSEVAAWLEDAAATPTAVLTPRVRTLPVHYGGAHGPDLTAAAHQLGLSEQEVVQLHSQTVYTVYMLGFAPGFAYLGSLPTALHLPRRLTPRMNLPAGAVLMAGAQTAVLPQVLPSGWHQIGWTPTPVLDWQTDPPMLLQPGDQVRFVAVEVGW